MQLSQIFTNDEVRRLTKQPHLSAIVQSRRLSLFGHIAWMPDETDAKQILTASPTGNWTKPLGHPRITWMKTIQQDLKSSDSIWTTQLTWLRTVHSGDWYLRSALRTLSGACQKWWWWWCVYQKKNIFFYWAELFKHITAQKQFST